MKRTAFMIALLLASAVSIPAAPNFGSDGLGGLSKSQKAALAGGKIVFYTSEVKGKHKSALIQAAIVFNNTPDKVWSLLYRTQDQIKYLEEIEKINIINKGAAKDNLEFHLSVAWLDYVYRVIHRFKPGEKYFYWGLDKSFKNDLKDLRGYWRLYPYGNGKTLARYGSNVSIKNVPSFIENMFKKNGVKKSLQAVRRYINSNGTWRVKR